MSATTAGQKRKLIEAKADAGAFYRLFPPTCYVKWMGAGSLRRERETVGDVEHVIIPAFGTVTEGLFGEVATINLLWHHLDSLVSGDLVGKAMYGDAQGYRWGEKYRGVTFRGFTHEIFTATAENWGSVLAIRTGPRDFSKRLVTGLRDHCYRNHEGYVWRCVPCEACLGGTDKLIDPLDVCEACNSTGLMCVEKVAVPEERDFFKLAGVAYVEPPKRF